ncbi:uncharacterized protein ASCRUDRAFT_144374 [Ascoidea rubescens DSM 1968]|uniref:Uncharacterized protein n=1 Tax=Ascoidea rubescens DSM 1968 TaxID=1344418 RepID=A0A1D2VJ84_9ASCO|nr:hypothetical protein ASCRUDRAFT_144374 [Ascoidea rubescens DSM 1968]ODV61691.1 hypothetical protein ASCRUDRAFT_144374 [Ascoidea rubescens DSM 1968]
MFKTSKTVLFVAFDISFILFISFYFISFYFISFYFTLLYVTLLYFIVSFLHDVFISLFVLFYTDLPI